MDENIDMPIAATNDAAEINYVDLTADITAAYLSNNHIQAAQLPSLITGIHAALANLNGATQQPEQDVVKLTPSRVRKSITPDALISFIDGKPYKTLKRHLTKHGLTIEQYRERYGLPLDYPATTANYSAQRSALARSLGLGQQRRTDASSKSEPGAAADAAPEKPRKVGRPRKAKAANEA